MNETEIMQDIRDDYLEEHGFWDDMHAYDHRFHVGDGDISDLNDAYGHIDERRDTDACR